MSPRITIGLAIGLALVIFGGRFTKIIPPGHVGVAVLFGKVVAEPYPEGIRIVNPLYNWVIFDVRQKTHEETAQVPTRDQLQTKVDVSVQYRFIGTMAPNMRSETGGPRR